MWIRNAKSFEAAKGMGLGEGFMEVLSGYICFLVATLCSQGYQCVKMHPSITTQPGISLVKYCETHMADRKPYSSWMQWASQVPGS